MSTQRTTEAAAAGDTHTRQAEDGAGPGAGAPPRGGARSRPIGLWRLEGLRLLRSFRLLAAAALFAVFGMTGPFMAMYANEIITRTNPDLAAELPPPQPAESVATFVDNSIGLGVLVVVVVAAATLAVDARPSLSLFYRTRVRSAAALVLPRFTAVAVGMIAAYALGAALTWYQTAVLIGPVPPRVMALGSLFVAVYLAFAVALVALAASLFRGLVAVISVPALVLLGLPALALWPTAAPWVPSALIGAQAGLLHDAAASDYLPALGVTVAATAVCLGAAVRLMGRREI